MRIVYDKKKVEHTKRVLEAGMKTSFVLMLIYLSVKVVFF